MPNSRKGSCQRAKVRGRSFQEAPRTSGNVSRSERSKKRWPEVMREPLKHSVIGEEKSSKF